MFSERRRARDVVGADLRAPEEGDGASHEPAGSEIRPYQHRTPLGTMSNVASTTPKSPDIDHGFFRTFRQAAQENNTCKYCIVIYIILICYYNSTDAAMIIRTMVKSVCYPAFRQQTFLMSGSARVRFVRGSLLISAKLVQSPKPVICWLRRRDPGHWPISNS